jgi:tetratricopeptide (TPR) repeat protein
MLHGRRGRAYSRVGEWNKAVADLSQAIALRPKQDALWKFEGLFLDRGDAYAEMGRSKEAADDLSKACEQDPRNPSLRMGLALIRLEMDDIIGYRKTCSRLLNDFGQTEDSEVAVITVMACSLVPEAVEDREALVRLAQKAVDATKDEPKDELRKHRVFWSLGVASYRAERFAKAIGHLNDAMKALPSKVNLTDLIGFDPSAYGGVSLARAPGGVPSDWLLLAMAHYRLGLSEDAKKWLTKAVASMETGSSSTRIAWKDRIVLRVLRREAESLINGKKPSAK